MSKYARMHKRISALDDIDKIDTLLGAHSSDWVTVVDRKDDDDDYAIQGNRVAVLTTSGVVYADQLPGAYGPQEYLLIGRMVDGEFYVGTSTTPVIPDKKYMYLDTLSADPHGTMYRWNHTAMKYVVCPNTYRVVGDYGLKLGFDIDGAHRLAWFDLKTGEPTLPEDSASDPDDAASKSIRDGRSLGYDEEHNLVHSKQPLLAAMETREFGDADQGDVGFGGKFTSPYIHHDHSHIVEIGDTEVTFPGNISDGSKKGIVLTVDIDSASVAVLPGTIGTGSAGTIDGNVAAVDHVHGCENLKFTRGKDNNTVSTYSLASDCAVDAINAMFGITDYEAPTSADSTPRLFSGYDILGTTFGEWKTVGEVNAHFRIVTDDVTVNGSTLYTLESDFLYKATYDTTNKWFVFDPAEMGLEYGMFPLERGVPYILTARIGITLSSSVICGEMHTPYFVVFNEDGFSIAFQHINVDMSIPDMTQWFNISLIIRNNSEGRLYDSDYPLNSMWVCDDDYTDSTLPDGWSITVKDMYIYPIV